MHLYILVTIKVQLYNKTIIKRSREIIHSYVYLGTLQISGVIFWSHASSRREHFYLSLI